MFPSHPILAVLVIISVIVIVTMGSLTAISFLQAPERSSSAQQRKPHVPGGH